LHPPAPSHFSSNKQHPSPGGRKPADDFVMPPRSPRCSSAASRARNHEIVRTTRCPNPPGCPNPPSARVPEPPAVPRRRQHRVVGSPPIHSLHRNHTHAVVKAVRGPRRPQADAWAPPRPQRAARGRGPSRTVQPVGTPDLDQPEVPAISFGSTPEAPPAVTGWQGLRTQQATRIDPRATAGDDFSDLHLQPQPSSDFSSNN